MCQRKNGPLESIDSYVWTRHRMDEQWRVLASTLSPNLVILTSEDGKQNRNPKYDCKRSWIHILDLKKFAESTISQSTYMEN